MLSIVAYKQFDFLSIVKLKFFLYLSTFDVVRLNLSGLFSTG